MPSDYQLETDLASKVMGWEYCKFPDATPTLRGKPIFYIGWDGVYVRDAHTGIATKWNPRNNLQDALNLLEYSHLLKGGSYKLWQSFGGLWTIGDMMGLVLGYHRNLTECICMAVMRGCKPDDFYVWDDVSARVDVGRYAL